MLKGSNTKIQENRPTAPIKLIDPYYVLQPHMNYVFPLNWKDWQKQMAMVLAKDRITKQILKIRIGVRTQAESLLNE